MNRRVIGALLAGALCMATVAPAGAVNGGGSAAVQEEAPPETLTVKQMGLRAVERAVSENNASVQSLRKTAASMDTGSSLSEQFEAQGGALELQIKQYQEMIGKMEEAMEQIADKESDLYKTYEAQKKLLENQRDSLQQSADSLPVQGAAAVMQIEDAVYQLRKQADNVADQLTMAAQTLLISIQNLQYSQQKLERQLASLDRSLDVMETQLSLGLVSQYQMDTVRNQRDNLALGITNLQTQCNNLASSLALMCGYDAGTLVMPAAFAAVTEKDLKAMSYEADLEETLKNSFSIWQKRNTLRQAQNVYDDSYDSSVYAVQSAREALAIEQESVEAAFASMFQSVQDCRGTLQAAQAAEQQAELDFETSQLQYERGMLSRLDYLQAQDTLENAKLDVQTAELGLVSAFNQYEWAKRGLTTAIA